MYKYAEEKLTEELRKKEHSKKENEQELNEISEKLKSIQSYDKLQTVQSCDGIMCIFLIIVAIFCAPISIICIIRAASILTRISGFMLGLISIGFICVAKIDLKDIKTRAKEIELLKQKGVKEFIKQKEHLQEQELVLKKENDNIQNTIDEITTVLEHINFFKETSHDLFYQADSKEEYKTALLDSKLKCEQLWNEYLNEKIDYSSIHLPTFSEDIDSQKLQIKLRK